MKVPPAVGVPLIVIVLPAQAADTPVGKPVVDPIPVAPTVVWLISVKAVLMQRVGVEDAAETVLLFTVMVPVAFTAPQPPVKGIE